MFNFFSTKKDQNWEKFFGEAPKTKKTQLIHECKKHDITIYIDDVTEDTSNNPLRGVASEAELERRLNAKRAVDNSKHANIIAITAVIISLISLAVTYYANMS